MTTPDTPQATILGRIDAVLAECDAQHLPPLNLSPATPHTYQQNPVVAGLINVCRCGLWPHHHIHTGDQNACTCHTCHEPTGRGLTLNRVLIDEIKYPTIGTEKVISYGHGADIPAIQASWIDRLLAGQWPWRARRRSL